MNIIKKLPLMAFVLGLGFVFSMSSFKAEKKFSVIYYQTTNGHYTKTVPSGEQCAVTSSNPCTYSFSGTPSASSFNLPNVPTDGGTAFPSGETGRTNP